TTPPMTSISCANWTTPTCSAMRVAAANAAGGLAVRLLSRQRQISQEIPMRPVGRLLLLTILLAGAAPAVSLPEPTPEELEANRRLLERYRADPEHFTRLKRDLKAFAALPPERQARLRQLD